MTYLERLNDFFAYAHANKLSASAQLTYLTILNKWNSLRRPQSFVCSINEISRLSSLSTSRVADAIHSLTSRLLLKIVKTGKYTEYLLPDKPIGTIDRTQSATKRQGAPPLELKKPNNSLTNRETEEAVASGKSRDGLINVSYTINELKQKWLNERPSDEELAKVRAKAQEYMDRLRNSTIDN